MSPGKPRAMVVATGIGGGSETDCGTAPAVVRAVARTRWRQEGRAGVDGPVGGGSGWVVFRAERVGRHPQGAMNGYENSTIPDQPGYP